MVSHLSLAKPHLQGSHLSTLFFIIYIQEIKSCLKQAHYFMYSDSLKIDNKV